MRILNIHNSYQQPGGEDEVFRAESELLSAHGHTVIRYEETNSRIGNGWATGLTSIWNQASHHRLRDVIRQHRPSVAHFHNTFPLISPAGYYAVRAEGIPVIQKLSNFRLLCPGANLYRDGHVCEECLEKRSLLPALQHACYRDSRPATAAVAAMLATHRAAGTWDRLVDLYIAPTEFVRRKFIAAGFAPHQIVVKPHMVWPDPGVGPCDGPYALFVGRLSPEKGIETLRRAWNHLPEIPLRIVGDGPADKTGWPSGVELLGNRSRTEVFELMRRARVLVVPSECYEIGPLTVIEAFACGLPVIASGLGSIAERVEHGRTGLLFEPGDERDLARRIRWAFDHPAELRRMSEAARHEYERKYTAERNYTMLMEIYHTAIENSLLRHRAAS